MLMGSNSRLARGAFIGITVVILVASATRFAAWGATLGPSIWGHDYRFYMVGVRLWLSTGSPFDPRTLAGPYAQFPDGAFLHPPIALPLMAPFAVLPWILWWVLPVAVILVCIRAWEPPTWSWPVIALGAAYWGTCSIVAAGNSTLWVAALFAAGFRLGWPAALIAVKPTLVPLALVGVRRRSWWVAGGIMAIVSLLLLPLWPQWLTAIRNAPLGLTYNSEEGLGLYWIVVSAWAAGYLHRRAGSDGRLGRITVVLPADQPS